MSGLVWYNDKLLTPFLQPYSLYNNTITGYNGASAKVNAVFTARRYALAVCRPVSVSLSATFPYCIQMAEDIIKRVFRPGSATILVF